MLRVCFVLAILIPYVAAELDGCAAAMPDAANPCHEDATILLQRHGLKMIERAPTEEKPSQLKTEVNNKCLDYDFRANNAIMHPCHGGDNQKWYFDGERLKEKRDGKCMDWDYGVFGDGVNVILHPCHTGDNQKWYFDGKALKSRRAPKCLDYDSGASNVIMHDCHGGDNQKWSFDPVDCKLSDWTDWSMCSKTCGSGRRSRSRTVTTKPENGGKECPVDTEDSEECSVQDCPALLKTKRDDNCLDLNLAHDKNDNVFMHDCHGGDNQKWYFDGEHIKTQHDNRCLDYDQRSDKNRNVYVHQCHDGNNQKWYFDGRRLRTREDGKCLDYDYSLFAGDNVYMHDCHDGDNQKWYFSS